MSIVPGLENECDNCYLNCVSKGSFNIGQPLSFTNRREVEAGCVKKCYENVCKGATSWPRGTWKENYYGLEGKHYDKITLALYVCLIMAFIILLYKCMS